LTPPDVESTKASAMPLTGARQFVPFLFLRRRRLQGKSCTKEAPCAGLAMSNDGSPIEPIIRRAQESDYITICRHQKMVHAAHAAQMPDRFRPPERTDFSYLQFRSCLTGPNLLLIAEFGGEPAGSLLAVIDNVCGGLGFQPTRRVVIWHVVTEAALRRRGVARALIAAAAEWANNKGADRIDLSVWSFNGEALAAYRQLGFTEYCVDMMIRPSAAIARWGSGRLPPPTPNWLVETFARAMRRRA
jgi:ribosomal protein S18 acetylase RimI-like enzyme